MYYIKNIMKIIKENQNTKAVNLENMNVDFEENLLNAITNRFPNVKLKVVFSI